jgi:3-oxoadipate enol-lactonase
VVLPVIVSSSPSAVVSSCAHSEQTSDTGWRSSLFSNSKETESAMGNIQKIAAGDATLAVQVDGNEGLPWVVFSNSLAGSMSSWDPQVAAFAKTHRVLRYDTRGHGQSSTPKGPYSFDILVSDLIGLMDHFKIEKADVVGLSMGGMTALGVAINHSARVNRVVCCDGRSDAPQPFIDSWNARAASIREHGMAGVVDFSIERWFTPAFREAHPDIVRSAANMIRATDPEGYIACTEALKRLDYKKDLGSITMPALFVVGAQDQAAPPGVLKEMSELTPNGSFVSIDPGAHICNMENPSDFNRAVCTWLAA